MMSPEISLVIPTFNRARMLGLTLESIRRQTESVAQFEVIVVDDGSTENFSNVLSRYDSNFPISCYSQARNGYRVASARNLGIYHARGRIVLFVDAGIILHSDCLHQHISWHSSQTGLSVVIGAVLGLEVEDFAAEVLEGEIDLNDTDRSIEIFCAEKRYLDVRPVLQPGSQSLAPPYPWAYFWTGNASVDRTLLLNLTGFDPGFDGHWGMEDIELGFRLSKAGAEFNFNASAMSLHFPHHNDLVLKHRDEFVNKQYFIAKHTESFCKKLLEVSPVTFNSVDEK